MKWVSPLQLVREYAQVLVTMFVAGVITGSSCAALPIPQNVPLLPLCAEPVRLMPNWILDWDQPRLDRQA